MRTIKYLKLSAALVLTSAGLSLTSCDDGHDSGAYESMENDRRESEWAERSRIRSLASRGETRISSGIFSDEEVQDEIQMGREIAFERLDEGRDAELRLEREKIEEHESHISQVKMAANGYGYALGYLGKPIPKRLLALTREHGRKAGDDGGFVDMADTAEWAAIETLRLARSEGVEAREADLAEGNGKKAAAKLKLAASSFGEGAEGDDSQLAPSWREARAKLRADAGEDPDHVSGYEEIGGMGAGYGKHLHELLADELAAADRAETQNKPNAKKKA